MIYWTQIKSDIPRKSGVYLFKDRKGKVIYVGKAIDLYHRVASYFQKSRGVYVTHPRSVLGSHLRKEIKSVETIVVESELEALILEANLIKRYLPQFNVRLTDDKDYLYIKITKEDSPKVVTARKHDLKGSLKYFGPFPSSRTVRETLKSLRRVFPWCAGGRKACFYYHLGLCPGPCAGAISKDEYRKNIRGLIKLLEGKKDQLVGWLVKDMENAAKRQNFEEASRIKKTLDGIAYLIQPNRVQIYLENPNFLEDQRILALESLKKALNLKGIPHRIEGYDISNIAGKEASGSMVVLTEGEIDKSQYRKFKIRITGRPNDVAMMKEMVTRRLTHSEWLLPDLIIVDGGRGQVNGVKMEVRRWRIPVYGLAKRMEWLYSDSGEVIKLSKANPGLKLLQKIRDEAHRFAITYHRKLHGTMIFK